MNNGYAICFNEWALDKEIKDELGLLLIISSLCAENGYCFASNKYFAELFDLSEETISRKVKLLERKNYISVEYEKKGCEIINRFIRLTKMSIHDYQICQSTIDKNVKDNNIRLNNIKEIDNNKLLSIKKKFVKPTLDEVKQYCNERKNKVNPQMFIDFYESKGWKIGNTPMKDWKACIRTWENKNSNNNRQVSKTPSWLDKNIETEELTEEEEKAFRERLHNNS